MNLRHALPILPLLIATVSAQDAAWPGFRGPRHDGVALDAAPPTKWSDKENLAWKLELPGPGSSSPIVVGDRIYVTCYTGYGSHLGDLGDPKKLVHHLVCVTRDTGLILWQKAIPGPLDQKARAVELSEHGFASPTPASDGEYIYTYCGRAGVLAFDLDGNKLWQTDLGVPSEGAVAATNTVVRGGKRLTLRWGTAASPVLACGLVFINASEQSNSILALDQKTGKIVWRHESANLEGCATTPAIVGEVGEQVLVMVTGGEIWGVAPKTGKMLWSVETAARGGMSPMPIADEEVVYTFGGSGASHALFFGSLGEDEEDEDGAARIVWQSENVDIPSPVLVNGTIYLVRTDGFAIAINAEDGEMLWKKRLEGRTGKVYASPTVAADHLYVVSRRRGTFVYSIGEVLELVERNEFAEHSQFNASPAIVGKQIFLRSDTHLYCISR